MSSFRISVTEDFLFKYDTMSVGDQVLVFGGNIVSSSSRSKVLEECLVEHLFFEGDDNMLPQNIRI